MKASVWLLVALLLGACAPRASPKIVYATRWYPVVHRTRGGILLVIENAQGPFLIARYTPSGELVCLDTWARRQDCEGG